MDHSGDWPKQNFKDNTYHVKKKKKNCAPVISYLRQTMFNMSKSRAKEKRENRTKLSTTEINTFQDLDLYQLLSGLNISWEVDHAKAPSLDKKPAIT